MKNVFPTPYHFQGLITELEKGLGSIIRRHDPGGGGGDTGDAIDAMASILTPNDETQYWADVANSSRKKEEREKASAFWNTLEPVANEFNNLNTMQMQGKLVGIFFFVKSTCIRV